MNEAAPSASRARPMRTSRGTVTDLVVVLVAIAALSLITDLVDSYQQVLVQVIGAALVVGYAWWRGYSTNDLGLASRSIIPGLRLGGVIALVIIAGVTIVSLAPFGRDFFRDDRFLDLSTWTAVYEVGIRIPFVTALTEELLFRSVLLAVLLALTSTRWAVVWTSFAFGLWHVGTTLGDLEGNDATDSLTGPAVLGAVVVTVAATGAAGLVFAWARLRSNSLAAPWLIHTAFNATAWVAGLVLTN